MLLLAAAQSAPAALTSSTTTSGSKTIVSFTAGSGTWTVPAGVGGVHLLVVAGGGGGGTNGASGGGGAGGLVYYGSETPAAASSYAVTPGQSYNITVGAGGAAHVSGQNSIFGTVTAVGGGYGGQRWSEAGGVGGSGGGASVIPWGPITSGANGTSGQGHAGGGSSCTNGQNKATGGGGGGAGTAGSVGTPTQAGKGGDGLPYTISGSSVTYAGGGGGSMIEASLNGVGGTGYLNPGGGGLSVYPSGTTGGQSGIVIVSYEIGVPAVDHFAISTISSPQTAGTSITGITITAQDGSGATVTGFTGTVTFGGTAGVTGTSASFTAGVLSGVSVTPTVAGSGETITVSDGARTGSTTITTINPGTANKLAFTTQPGGGAAGSAWTTQPVVTVQDTYGNTVTGSSASITLAKTSGTPAMGGPGTLSGTATEAASSGVATFSGLSIDKSGTGYKLTATSAGLTGADSSTFGITGGAASTLTVSGFAGSQPAGAAGSVTVTAKDTYGNIATGYTGTVHFTSTDGAAGLPSNYTFVGGDNGAKTFSATLNTIGTQSITATDTVTGVLTGTQSGISVIETPSISTFTSNGTWTAPAGVTSVQLLVVGGGGGGGDGGIAGGGGAGGLIYYGFETPAAATSYTVTPGQTYSVTVGAGGAVHTSGQNSSFGAVTAVGGGYGGKRWGEAGGVGGSGGGAALGAWYSIPSGAAGTAGQGYAGGGSLDSNSQQYAVGGGGGGAKAVGSNARLVGVVGAAGTLGYAGNGGDGLPYSISGIAFTYAGGGGGSGLEAGYNGYGGAGYLNAGGGGMAGTPGAGGTGIYTTGSAAAGQTGIVIVKYVPFTLDHFAISTISSPQAAGTPITGITITAQDSSNTTVTAFTGTVTFGGTAGITGTSANFTSGVLTGLSVTPTVAGSNLTFAVGGDSKTGEVTIGTITPGALDHFAISTISSPQVVGTAIDVTTITAKDTNNNTVTGFTGTVDLTETGGGAGGTVTPAQSGAFTAGVLANQSVSLSKAGSNVTLTATDHAGTGKTGASGTFTIDKGTSSVTVAGTTSFTYTGAAQGPSTASVTGSTGAVTYSYVGVSPTTYGPSATKPTNAGSYTVTATVAADSNYNSASSTATGFTIGKADQMITFATLLATTVGDAPSALTATTSSGLTVSYVSSAPAVASVAGGTVTSVAAGSTHITASQAGDDNHNAATSVTQALTVMTTAFGTQYHAWISSSTTLTGAAANPDADPDSDGVTNMMEYALATNPQSGSSGPGGIAYEGASVTAHGQPIQQDLSTGTGGVDFRAVFGRRKDAASAGLTYTMQFSVDNSHWVDSTATQVDVLASDSTIEAVSEPYPLFIPVTGGYKKPTFFRVAVSSN